jgi:hypothetical protein
MEASRSYPTEVLRAEGYPPLTTVEQMQADLVELLAAERRRARLPRHSAEWVEAVTVEDIVRTRIRRWILPRNP